MNINDAGEYFRSGRAKFINKDYKGAISDYDMVLMINPTDAEAYLERGKAKDSNEDYIGAIVDFTKVIEIVPLAAGAFFWRGLSKSSLPDFSGAIADFTAAIEIKPNYASAYFRRGEIKKVQQNHLEALDDFSKAIEINFKYADAYELRGMSKIELGQKESGLLDIKMANELNNGKASETIKEYPKQDTYFFSKENQSTISNVFLGLTTNQKISIINLLVSISVCDLDEVDHNYKESDFINQYLLILNLNQQMCNAYLETQGPNKILSDLKPLSQFQKEFLVIAAFEMITCNGKLKPKDIKIYITKRIFADIGIDEEKIIATIMKTQSSLQHYFGK